MPKQIKIMRPANMGPVPKTQQGRIKELMQLPLSQKVHLLPPAGSKFKLGPFVFQVAVVHAGKLRITARLIDVIIDGVNDGSEKVSPIINPNTGEGIIKG